MKFKRLILVFLAIVFFIDVPYSWEMEEMFSKTGEEDEQFGKSVSSLGDLNEDGYDDLIVGAPGRGRSNFGKAFIFFGDSTMDTIPDCTLFTIDTISDTIGANFGEYVAGNFDINNNDSLDFIVYEHLYLGEDYDLDVYHKLHFYLDSRGEDFSDTVVYSPIAAGQNPIYKNQIGHDVNGDGIDDLILPNQERGHHSEGCILFLGNEDFNPYVNKKTFFRERYSWSWGYYSLDISGDFNGDGCKDILIGNSRGYDRGALFIYLGGDDLDTIPDYDLHARPEDSDFDACFYIHDWHNGYEDIFVCQYGPNPHSIYFGGTDMDTIRDFEFSHPHLRQLGDFNGDGRKDYVEYGTTSLKIRLDRDDSISILEEPDYVIPISFSARPPVLNYGDFNGDGIDDLVVGREFVGRDRGNVKIFKGEYWDIEGIDEGTTPLPEGKIEVYPNPFDKNLNLRIKLQRTSKVNIDIYSINGRKINSEIEILKGGDNNLKVIRDESLRSGIYIIQVRGDDFVGTLKAIKLN